MRSFLVKRTDASDYLLLFLICGVISVLATRFLLWTLDYPQIAQGRIHLAHSIIGGLLLLTSNIFLFSFHGKRVRQFATMLGGLGFGQLIDEVGKFITRDNNYFFQPVPVIIYLTFIVLFFLYRYLDQYTPRKPKELFYEALEGLEDIAENNLHQKTKKMIVRALEKIQASSEQTYYQIASGFLETVEKITPVQKKQDNRYVAKIRSSWRWIEEFTTERRPVFYVLLSVFLLYILNTLLTTISFITIFTHHQYEQFHFHVDSNFEVVMAIAQLGSQIISAIVMTRGFWFLVNRKKIRALELFKNGLAINILVTHVFMFYFQQFAVSVDLLVTIGMYAIVHNILEEESS